MSHIIPELLYRPLYGPTHQIRSVRSDLPYIRFLRKGLREELLCADCEALLGEYESYFAGRWYGPRGLPREIPAGVDLVERTGIDYTLFKLFHLSILWRSSVATLDAFSSISLADDQERIRMMLLNRDPGREDTYRLAASILLRPGSREVHGGVISVPARLADERVCVAVYGGCFWIYFLSSQPEVKLGVLRERGSLRMTVIDIRNVPIVFQGLGRAATARRRPRPN